MIRCSTSFRQTDPRVRKWPAIPLGLAVVCLLAMLGGACDEPSSPEPRLVEPIISRVTSSTPITTGSTLVVTVANLDALGDLGDEVQLEIGGLTLLSEAPSETPQATGSEARFVVTSQLIDGLGEGSQTLELVVTGRGLRSEPYSFTTEVSDSISIGLSEGVTGSYYRNDLAIVDGAGFLEPDEGTVVARVTGTFTPDEGPAAAVSVDLPVLQAEPGNRARGAIRLTAGLSGIVPGTFEGTVVLLSEMRTGFTSMSAEHPIDVVFEEPLFLGLEPSVTSLEGVVRVRGAGFLGSTDDEVTILRVEGSFSPEGGGTPEVFSEDLVLAWVSGSELAWPMTSRVDEGQLVSTLFGYRRGQLSARFTPITILGTDEYEGVPGDATLTLGPQRQVVFVKLLPGFFESLPRFGLAAGADLLNDAIVARLSQIYADWNIEFTTVRPQDVTPSGVTTIEVGGPDPNGLGLFGYDNSPGKDVGNLRLGDTIGGANAETLADGSPGYGGVFIDGFLFFSESAPPESGFGPEADPLFDEIFAGVRDEPATLAEVQGSGPRAAEVARAIRALANMIGETTGHELGHSLGLADPSGSATTFHNAEDGPGCLMDSGSARPLGERIAEPSYPVTHLCGDHPNYLDEILGRN